MKHRRYIIQEKIGAGGMGTVYTAKDRLTGDTVALKRVLLTSEKMAQDSNTNFLTALATEFRTLAGLRHPHIVRVIDYGFSFEDGQPQPYFTMEYLSGAQTLTKAAHDQPLETQVRLLTEMLMALAYLHRRGVIHRDLKPDNVLVDSSGRAKVLDFGLALETSGKSDFSLTAGTLAYMAPELFAENPATVQSDLYAVGILMYEIFTGQFPFNQKDITLLLDDIINRIPDMSMLDVQPSTLLARLLAKDPSARPGSAEDVIRELCEATGQPLPPESIAIRESFLQASRFVGRSAEMDPLKTALNNALNGQEVQVYLIGGESGVGKSRLLDELRTHALVKGAMVLRGQGIAEGGLPFQLWRDIARELALNTELSDLEASILKDIVPDISTLLTHEVADASQLSGGDGQQRLTLTLVDLLKRQTQPIVLLLEDLQWAGSLSPLKQMMTVHERLTHLLVIGTYRDDERPDLPDIFPTAQTIKLTRLNDAAMADLTQSMLGSVGTQPKILDLLKRETEGNAFFIVETVRALAEDAGTLSEIGSRTLPQHVFAGGVGQIIRRRLSRVPDFARPLLQEMAAAGRWLDLKIMEASSSTSMEDINTFLTVCTDAGVLEIVEGRWRFTHDKLRETLLRDLSETERHDLHRKVAMAIEVAYPDDEGYYEILLEHWRIVGDSARELQYLVPVVRSLVDNRADFDQAVLVAEHGLTLGGDTDRHRPALLNLLGKVKWQMNDYSAALQLAEQALHAAEHIGDQQSRADSLRIQGQVLSDKGESRLAADYFQQSMVICRDIGDRQGIAENLLTLGIVTHNLGDYSLAADYYQQSLAIYRDLGDQVGIGNNLGNLGNVAESQRDFTTARDYAEQAMTLFQAVGNQRNVAVCLSNIGSLAYQQGDYAAASSYLQQGLIMSRETGHRLHTAFALNALGLIELAQGNLTRTASLFHEALALGDAIDALPVLLETLVSLARLNLRTDVEVFAAELAGLIEHHPSLDDEVRIGEFAKLKRELEAALPADELEAALERGKILNVKTVTKKFLAEDAS
jgi:tetratricopeptide (TPR) repeat protein